MTTLNHVAVSLVLSEKANQIEKFAAEELARYLSRIVDKKVVISTQEQAQAQGIIFIGTLPSALDKGVATHLSIEMEELGDDGFIVRSLEDNLLILGKTPRATLFGIYHYLQLLGVRWYFPGEEYEYVPKREGIQLKGINVRESPAFTKRGIVLHFKNTALRDWIDFAAKVKLNTIALHSLEGIDKMQSLLAERGLDFNLEIHFFGSNFCSANLEELEKNRVLLRKFLTSLPIEMSDFFLWKADEPLARCDCERDRDFSVADQTLLFMNRMLDVIREVKPTAKLAFLAYWGTWQPPTIVKPAEGIFLEMAPIHSCFSHSICDPSCVINKGEVLPVMEELLKVFNPREAQVLGYWLDSSLFGRGRFKNLRGRIPQFGDIIKEDINYYLKKSVSAITTFVVGLDKEYFSTYISPAVFQYALLLWNPQTDLKSEQATFCKNFYGRGDLVEVFELREQIDPKDFNFQQWEQYSEKILRAIETVEKALKEAESEVIQARLNKLLGELYHLRMWLESVDHKFVDL